MPNALSNFIGITQLLARAMQYILPYLVVYLFMRPAEEISKYNLEL